MKPKEINKIIQEQTEQFFRNEGFKYSSKDMGYLKNIDGALINYGFSYVEYHPEYYYDIEMFVRLNRVEETLSIVDGSSIQGNTGIFPVSYFLNPGDSFYKNKNPDFLIEKTENVQRFSEALIENYREYFKNFIPQIIQPKNMIDFLLSEIKEDIYDTNSMMRVLILLKLTEDSRFEEKQNEFKDIIKGYSEEDQKKFSHQMDRIVFFVPAGSGAADPAP